MNNPPKIHFLKPIRQCPVCGKKFEMYYGNQVDPDNPVCFECWKDRERARSGNQFDGDWNDPSDPAFWDRHDIKNSIEEPLKALSILFKKWFR